MQIRGPAVLAALLALTACTEARRGAETAADTTTVAPPRPEVLRFVPKPGLAVLMDTSGSLDAEQEVYRAAISADSVARWFRQRLPTDGWQVIGDVNDRGILNLHAVKDRSRLWVRIRPLLETTSEYIMIGSMEPDSTAADSTR